MLYMKKLYVIIRGDLNPGLLAAQACHAAATFCLNESQLAIDWRTDQNLIVLSSPTKESLAKLLYDLIKHGIKTIHFQEPDLNNELTAIACREEAKPLIRQLKLALAA